LYESGAEPDFYTKDRYVRNGTDARVYNVVTTSFDFLVFLSQKEANPPMPPGKRRVLCVEPHGDTCSMLSALLAQQGFETDSATTIAEASEKARSNQFCLYIVNDGYVDGTNVGLIEHLRALTPDVPTLVFSTQDWGDDRRKAMEAGAQVYITKPSELGKMLQAIHRLCGDVAPAA
jgi:CheY-like chemotaxis protein